MLTNCNLNLLQSCLPSVFAIFILTSSGSLTAGSFYNHHDDEMFGLQAEHQGSDLTEIVKNNLAIYGEGYFIENKGQWSDDVKFISDHEDFRMVFKESSIIFFERDKLSINDKIVIEFLCAENVTITGHEMLNDTINLFIGNDPGKWTTSIHKFNRIEFRNQWDSSELDFYYDMFGLNYEMKEIGTNEKRSVEIKTYLEINEDIEAIGGQMHDLISSLLDEEAFYHPNPPLDYDEMRLMTMAPAKKNQFDPLIFCSYIGGDPGYPFGFDEDKIKDMDMDGTGNIFIAGRTWSNNFPIREPCINPSNNGYFDIIISKIDLINYQLIASTYIGGSGFDGANSFVSKDVYLAIDKNDNIHIAACTNSTDFPITPEAYDSEMNGSWDIALVKMNNDLSELEYSTYIGGSRSEYAGGIVINSNNIPYIICTSDSPDFPTTEGAYDRTYNGDFDCAVFSMNENGSHLLASTFIGGGKKECLENYHYGNIIVKNDDIIIGGNTVSSNYPVTTTAYCTTNKGSIDSFISILNNNLSILLASTYFGGSYEDYLNGLNIDSQGNIIGTGETRSFDFPTTSNAYMKKRDPTDQGDSFLFKMNANLTHLISSSYIGGPTTEGEDKSYCIISDLQNNIYICGGAGGPQFPVTYGAFDTVGGGAFICKFDPDISELLYSTFFRSYAAETILLDKDLNVIIAGSCGSSIPVTPNAFQKNLKGIQDGFIAILNLSLPPTPPRSPDHELGNGFLQLSWEPPLKDGGMPVRGYNIYKTEPELPEYICKEVGSDILYFNDTDIVNGRTYHYRVTAFNDLGESLPSPQLKVEDNTPPSISFIGPDDAPTTGDRFTVRCRVKDNVLVEGVFIEYRFNLEPRKNWSMEGLGNDIYSYSLDIPTNATGVLSLKVSALDPSWNWMRSIERTFEILDNDDPVLLNDRTVKYATTGSPFTFSVSFKDNIGMDKVTLEYRYNDELPGSVMMELDDGSHSYTINVKDVVGSIHYRFLCVDTSGNWLNTTEAPILLQDGIPPVIKKDLSQDHASTGDEFIFKAEVFDTYGLYSVSVEHWIGSSPHQFLDMVGDEFHSASFFLPVDQIGTMRYTIRASDEAGNIAETVTVSVPIKDNDPPTMTGFLGESSTFTGDSYDIKASFSDNILLDRVNVIYRFGTGPETEALMVQRTDNHFLNVNVPINSVEPLTFRFVIFDKAGNKGSAGPFTIPVIDNIPPTIVVTSPLSGLTNDVIVINYTASDNIGIVNVSWDGPQAVFGPDSISCSFKDAGEYILNITVKDSEGNVGSAIVRIIIMSRDDNDGRSYLSIIIAIALLISIIITGAFAAFLFLAKRKPTDRTETDQKVTEDIINRASSKPK